MRPENRPCRLLRPRIAADGADTRLGPAVRPDKQLRFTAGAPHSDELIRGWAYTTDGSMLDSHTVVK